MIDKQMGLGCIALVTKKLAHKISPDEYYIALMELHDKYTMQGRNLTREAYRNHKERGLQPENFREAAEMYAHNRQRIQENLQKSTQLPEAKPTIPEEEVSF